MRLLGPQLRTSAAFDAQLAGAAGVTASAIQANAVAKASFSVELDRGADHPTDYAEIVVDAPQEQAVLITRAYKILDRLPVDEKIAWMLRHAEGEPLEVVASYCECSLATVKRRIAAAQSALGEELS